MNTKFIIALSLALFYLVYGFSAEASPLWDKKTKITINQPMEIPGQRAIVLPPGTYVLKRVDSPGSPGIVRFFNADETQLYATVIGVPDYRRETPERAEIRFYEAEPGRAHPIRAWFYPGDNYGIEFVYSEARAQEVAKAVEIAKLAGNSVSAAPQGN